MQRQWNGMSTHVQGALMWSAQPNNRKQQQRMMGYSMLRTGFHSPWHVESTKGTAGMPLPHGMGVNARISRLCMSVEYCTTASVDSTMRRAITSIWQTSDSPAVVIAGQVVVPYTRELLLG